MLGLEPGTVSISRPDARWRELFARERDRIQEALGPVALDIQHVGSTSIPGLPAKPIVDVAVAIKSYDDFFPYIPVIEKLGYVYRGENGTPRRHYFVLGEPRTVHLHFLEHDSDDWLAHLVFRNRMRRSPALRRRYLRIKRHLAAKYPDDRDAYTAGKQPFIHSVIDPVLAAKRRGAAYAQGAASTQG